MPWLNVAQNIFLNREPRHWEVVIDHRRMHQESRRLLESLDVHIDTTAATETVRHRHSADGGIVQGDGGKPRIPILDEPTAVLTEREVECLFRRIKEMRQQGMAIIFISHRLQEIREIGDRVTVLRDGKHAASGLMSDFSNDELVRIMVGRNISQMYPRHYRAAGEEVLRRRRLSVKGGPKNVDLVVRKGEIVGIAGLVGSGRTELAQAIFGIRQIEQWRGHPLRRESEAALTGADGAKGSRLHPRGP